MKGEGAEEGYFLMSILSGCMVKSYVSVTGMECRENRYCGRLIVGL